MQISYDPSTARVAFMPGLIEVFEPLAVTAEPIGEAVAEFVESLDPQLIEGAALDLHADLGQGITSAILATIARLARESDA